MKKRLLILLLFALPAFGQEVRIHKNEVNRRADGIPVSVLVYYTVYNVPGSEPGQLWSHEYTILGEEFSGLPGAFTAQGVPDATKAAAIQSIVDRETGEAVFQALEEVKVKSGATTTIPLPVSLQRGVTVLVDKERAKVAHDEKKRASTTTTTTAATTTSLPRKGN